MKWFDRIKKYFDAGFWNIEMVRNAVKKEKITKEQFKEITNKDYDT